MNPFDQFLDSIYIDQLKPVTLSFLLHTVDLLQSLPLTDEERLAKLGEMIHILVRNDCENAPDVVE